MIAFAVSLIGAAASPASGAMELSLERAIELALKHNEELQQFQEERLSARDRVDEAKSAVFPTLGLSYTYNRYFRMADMSVPSEVAPEVAADGSLLGGDGETPPGPDNPWSLTWEDVEAMPDHEHSFNLNVSQALFTSGRLRHYYRAAKAGIAGADLMYDWKKREVVFRVQEAYLNTLLAREALRIARASLENARNDHEIITRRFEEGLGSEFELMQHEVEMNNRRTGLITAENNLTLARNQLKVVIGTELEEEVVLTDSFNQVFPEFKFEEVKETMLAEEPSLRAREEAVRAGEFMWKLFKAEYFPQVGAYGSWGYSGGSDDFIPGGDDFEETLLAGVKVMIPLYEGGAKGRSKHQAFRDWNKSKLELTRMRKLLVLGLQNAFLAYQASQRELESARETVRLAEKAYELAQLRYRNGLGSMIELKDSELALTQARLLYSRATRDANVHLYKIQSYIGKEARNQP